MQFVPNFNYMINQLACFKGTTASAQAFWVEHAGPEAARGQPENSRSLCFRVIQMTPASLQNLQNIYRLLVQSTLPEPDVDDGYLV